MGDRLEHQLRRRHGGLEANCCCSVDWRRIENDRERSEDEAGHPLVLMRRPYLPYLVEPPHGAREVLYSQVYMRSGHDHSFALQQL